MHIPPSSTHFARLAAATLCGLVCAAQSGCVNLRDWTGEPAPEQAVELAAVDSREFTLLPGQGVVGELYTLQLRDGDTLPDVARHFGLGYDEIVAANPGIDPWVPTAGSRILLPLRHVLPDAPHSGIVLNLANLRLFHFPAGDDQAVVHTYPAGIGQEGWETPLGRTEVVAKKAKPSWYPPASIRKEHEENGDPLPKVVPPGPDNPLGDYALRLGMPSYLIHGTNKPYGVGMRVSHGCVRLYPEDIEPLFGAVAVGVPVLIVDQPYLVGWQSDMLYLEVHAPFEGEGQEAAEWRARVMAGLEEVARQRQATIDWERVDDALRRADGIPTPILLPSPGLAQMIAAAPVVAHPDRFFGQPEPVDLAPSAWSVTVADFEKESMARRVAAMLSHEGPPIPARSLPVDEQFVVIAGPFEDQQAAQEAANRIRRDFEFDAQPLPPEPMSGSIGAASQ